ncbi:MAG: T9SS type A sorting domain-containing protein, partial [Chitinophagaceae bacterium]
TAYSLRNFQAAKYPATNPQARFTFYGYGGLVGTWIYAYDTGHVVHNVDSSFYAGHGNYATYVSNPNLYEWLLGNSRQPVGNIAARVAAPQTLTQTGTVSPTVTTNAVTSGFEVTMSVSPNPVPRGQLARIQINSNYAAAVSLQVINSYGNVISTQKLNLYPGINSSTINTAALVQGFYIVRVIGTDKPVNIKLLVE